MSIVLIAICFCLFVTDHWLEVMSIVLIAICFFCLLQIIGLKSWHARVAILGYLQVMVFNNFFTYHQPSVIEEIQDVVFHLICDEQLEVIIASLLHC